jgi:hypothetical protein
LFGSDIECLDSISNIWIWCLVFGFWMGLVREGVNNSFSLNYGSGIPRKIFRDLEPKPCCLDLNLLLDNNNIHSLRFDNRYEIVNYLCGFGPKANPWSKSKSWVFDTESKYYSRFIASLHSKKTYPWKPLKSFRTRVSKFSKTPQIIVIVVHRMIILETD